jgi:son of sevenless
METGLLMRSRSRIFDLTATTTTTTNTTKGRLDLSSVDPLDLAQQLTLMEAELFRKIDPIDCIDSNRSKSTSIKTTVTWFNRMGLWVASEIVTHPNIKKRAAVIKYFINVMQVMCRLSLSYSLTRSCD